jgi:TolA-binding protein
MGSRKGHGHGRSPGHAPIASSAISPIDASGVDDVSTELPAELGSPALDDEPDVHEGTQLAAVGTNGTLPVVVAPLPARAATEAGIVGASAGAFKDLRRELAESHAVAVRTSNSVTTLAASLKEVITRQSRYDRGLNLNSFVAYVLFTALLGAGFFMLYRTRADQLVTERDQALRQQKAAVDEAQTARAELATRDAAEKKALEYWTLVTGNKREEAIARYPEVLHERLSPVERQVFDQSLTRARAEIVDAAYAEGLEAFQGSQWKRASAAFKKALGFEDEGPRAAQMHYYFGVSVHKQGDYAEAARQLEAALAGGAERTIGSDARYYLAGAYEQLRQFDKARTEYDRFANAHSLNPWAQTARRKSLEMGQKLIAPAAAAAPPAAAPAPR